MRIDGSGRWVTPQKSAVAAAAEGGLEDTATPQIAASTPVPPVGESGDGTQSQDRRRSSSERNDDPSTSTESLCFDFIVEAERYSDVNLLPCLKSQSPTFKSQLSSLKYWVGSDTITGKTFDPQKEDILLSWEPHQLEFGMTLLLWAAHTNRPRLTRFLVKECNAIVDDIVTTVVVGPPKGCEGDVSARNPCCVCGEWTPLMLASAHDHVAVVVTLLDCGASLHARDSSGYTALAHAALSGSVNSVIVLLKHGAPTQNVDGRGSTLQDLAVQLNSWDLYQLTTYMNRVSRTAPPEPVLQDVPLPSRAGARRRKMDTDAVAAPNVDQDAPSPATKDRSSGVPCRFPWQYLFVSGRRLWSQLRSTGVLCDDWELTALPVITILNILIISLSFYLELPQLLRHASQFWRGIMHIVCCIALPTLWILLMGLFKLPTAEGVLTDTYVLGETDVERLLTQFEQPDTLAYLGERENPFTGETGDAIRQQRKAYIRNAQQIRRQLDANRMCYACFALQPLRTFHCRYCQCCVRGFDHHCFWLRRCIGAKNHRSFVLFVLIACVIQHAHLLLIARVCFGLLTNRDALVMRPPLYRHVLSSAFFTVLSAVIHALATYWFHKLLWTQLRNVVLNLTTYEQLRGARYACNDR